MGMVFSASCLRGCINPNKKCRHTCIVNLGMYRTGTTTLAKSAECLGLKVYREFPACESTLLKQMLREPTKAATYILENHLDELLKTFQDFDFVCDGWIPLLPFLTLSQFRNFVETAKEKHIELIFVSTTRDVEEYVSSDLHNWVRYDIAKTANLSQIERRDLERDLRLRFSQHEKNLKYLNYGLTWLPLSALQDWPNYLSKVTAFSSKDWKKVLEEAGVQNKSPKLPVEGILITMRVQSRRDAVKCVERLLDSIESDRLCSYMVVLAVDEDEEGTDEVRELCNHIRERPRLKDLFVIINPARVEGEPFRICHSWHRMAIEAWKNGASWVVLLGDDVTIGTNHHYQSIYRAFLDIQRKLNCSFGFGCPWFDDASFPGFPTFPVVGRVHFEVFRGLIPEHRLNLFVNQDLDPYLQRLYLEYGAAPFMQGNVLTNDIGGNATASARYQRIPATGWRDYVAQDAKNLEEQLSDEALKKKPILLDIVIPTYRVDIRYLERLCSLKVPETMRTCFIVIVDNPGLLLKQQGEIADPGRACIMLERHLRHAAVLSGNPNNNIRVRCNDENEGASASRNRGLNESAANYVLFLDDDVIPHHDLLEEFRKAIVETQAEIGEGTFFGLGGLVRFPRQPDLRLKHAAILMSYLTFMFEIAANSMYREPAWFVTACLLVRRVPGMRFDTAYAMTGGGEDVDFCLRFGEAGGRFRSVPSAIVEHPFWEGGVPELLSHFYNWAQGDSALFYRFPNHVYPSFPNIAEVFVLLFLYHVYATLVSSHGGVTVEFCLYQAVVVWLLFLADFLVEALNVKEFQHRRQLLMPHPRSLAFCIAAHIMANFYVIVLEAGRLGGHIKRGHLLNFSRRFDWHCGRVPHARKNFVKKEFLKFLCFVNILSWMHESL